MNMEVKDHMDNSQGNTVPTGKTGPEITSKEIASVSVPIVFAEIELCRPLQEEGSGTDPGAPF